MSIFFLKDSADGRIGGVIISQESTKQNIIQAIQKVKENSEYTWDNLLKALPKDCSLHYDNNITMDTIYYQ